MVVHLKLYRGYANMSQIVIFGHVTKGKDPDAYTLDGKNLKFALTIIKLFTVKTIKNARVRLNFKDEAIETRTLSDGYFQFTIPYTDHLESGWHNFRVTAFYHDQVLAREGEFIKPYPGQYGFISDIDDTFLISHSDNFLKKLYVLLTQNINKRKIFEDVVAHYQLLSNMGKTGDKETNAFFYVSSSEWNLYNFIVDFTRQHGLPKAVLKLKDIKSGIGDFLFTGGGSHDHKFQKIKHLLEFYPELHFVLLGDDSQKDPDIYLKITSMFPANVLAVYIRQTGGHKKDSTTAALSHMDSLGVHTLYFKESKAAMAHSKSLGLV